MTNILQAEVTIKGTRPLFWHHFGPDSIPLEQQEKTGKAGNDPEEWRKTVLVNKDGQLYVLGTYFFGLITGGAKYVPKGRGSIQTDMYATLQVSDDNVLVDRWFPGFPNGKVCDPKKVDVPPQDFEQPVYLDVRYAINPSTKKANLRYRVAASPGWSCTFHILWDKTVINRSLMESAIIQAGNLVGLGNARKIGMGRFELISFEVRE